MLSTLKMLFFKKYWINTIGIIIFPDEMALHSYNLLSASIGESEFISRVPQFFYERVGLWK